MLKQLDEQERKLRKEAQDSIEKLKKVSYFRSLSMYHILYDNFVSDRKTFQCKCSIYEHVHVSTCWNLLFFPQEIKELQQSASRKVVTQQEQISQLTSEERAIEEEIQTESEALQKQISAQQDWISTVRNILDTFSCELEIVFAVK